MAGGTGADDGSSRSGARIMNVSRRTFGKLCAGGLAILATSGPVTSAATVLTGTKVRRLILLGGADRQCREFVSDLGQSASAGADGFYYDGDVDEIEMVRNLLADLVARRSADGVRKQFVAGLVGAHAYSVLETQFRDVQAFLVVRGLHVRRRGHERHEFLTTAPTAGIGQAFASLLTDSVDAEQVREHCLATDAAPMVMGRRSRGAQPTRLHALARVYGSVLGPAGCEAALLGLTRSAADGPLNHESFIFSV